MRVCIHWSEELRAGIGRQSWTRRQAELLHLNCGGEEARYWPGLQCEGVAREHMDLTRKDPAVPAVELDARWVQDEGALLGLPHWQDLDAVAEFLV